jgi:hypothetical protein
MAIGTEVVSTDGQTKEFVYQYIDADYLDGVLEAQIVPSEFAGGIGFFNSSGSQPRLPVRRVHRRHT